MLSAFQPAGLLELSSATPHAEIIYENIKKAAGPGFAYEPGSPEDAQAYATAMCIASAEASMVRGANQRDPELVTDMLPQMEAMYRVVPGPTASINDRQRVLAAKNRIAKGSGPANVNAALIDLLGDDFITVVTHGDAAESWPSDPSLGPGSFRKPSVVPKRFYLEHSITTLAVPVTFRYRTRAGSDSTQRLQAGDEVVAQLGNIGLAEKVVIESTTEDGGLLYATAAFEKVKEAGATLRVGTTPVWMSTTRHLTVVVASAAARDSETRRRVNALLHGMLRGVSNWSVVEPTADGEAGPFVIGESLLGLTPIETVTW